MWDTVLKACALGAVAIVWLGVLEQLRFFRNGSSKYPGPRYVLPFLNSLLDLIFTPEAFWNQQHAYDMDGMSWNAFLGRFVLVLTRPIFSRQVMANQGPDAFMMEICPNAKTIFSSGNIALMTGNPHKLLRKSFIPLFSRKALSMYLPVQETIIRSALMNLLDQHGGEPTEMQKPMRDLTLEISQRVFLGHYVRNRKQFSDDYLAVNMGMLCMPVNLPGTALWRACRGYRRLEDELELYSEESKKRMASGLEPTCLLDLWSQRILEEVNTAAKEGTESPEYSHPRRMANTMVDFLFAAQDATTAACCWLFKILADHSDVMKRICEEQDRLRPNDGPVTFEALQEMEYTRAAVVEMLRWKPPAMFIPQNAQTNITLQKGFVIPKGTLVFPSLGAAASHGWTNAQHYDPDRMLPARDEMAKNRANYLTFGYGPHHCVGQEYATNSLVLLASLISTMLDVKRTNTENSDRIRFLPTTYPYDCLITATRRAL